MREIGGRGLPFICRTFAECQTGSARRAPRGRHDVAIMMARIQVALSPEDQRRARARAAELGISFAEYVRRLVARDLAEARGSEDPRALFDLGDTGDSDVALEQHRYTGEAVEAAR